MGSSGTTTIFAHVCPKTTDTLIPIILPIRADVVNSNVPMLISHESPRSTKGPIDLPSRTLEIPSVAKTKLINAKSGHLVIQGQWAGGNSTVGFIFAKSPDLRDGNEITRASAIGRRNRKKSCPVGTLFWKYFDFGNPGCSNALSL